LSIRSQFQSILCYNRHNDIFFEVLLSNYSVLPFLIGLTLNTR
jgi:hypothetical protein